MAKKDKNNKSGKVLFRTDLFGFCKENVLAYLKNMDEATAEQIKSRDAQIDTLNSEIALLNSRISDFEECENSLVLERELISQTMIAAKETANKIINDARADAARERAELQQTYTAEINKLAAIRNEIIQLRKFAADAIRSFEQELSALERSTFE